MTSDIKIQDFQMRQMTYTSKSHPHIEVGRVRTTNQPTLINIRVTPSEEFGGIKTEISFAGEQEVMTLTVFNLVQ